MSSMRVAVVTPYYKEEWPVLERCLDSVKAQTHPCRHFVVADGHPQDRVAARDVEHFVLSEPHGDNGNHARGHGAVAAAAQGYNAIMFLDADNWYWPGHVAGLVDLHRKSGAAVCTSRRSFHRLDGSPLPGKASAWTDYVDTSCLCLFEPAFGLIDLWQAMPRQLGPVCDRLMWTAIKARGLPVAHSPEATVAFRSLYAAHYLRFNEVPPPGAKRDDDPEYAAALACWNAMDPGAQQALLLGTAG
jgi:hypothetical protein